MSAVPPSFWIETLGCKVNSAESERVAALLRRRGLRPAASRQEAGLRIVNSCSVTTSAAAQSRQATRRALALPVFGEPESPAKVIALGCWATSNTAEAEKMLSPAQGGVITHHEEDLESKLDQILTNLQIPRPGRAISLDVLGQSEDRQTLRQRAFLKIQDGCDAHCTYCIIPKLRTKLWSMPPEEAIEEVRRLVAAGHKEVVLTGIFLDAYGQETALRRRQSDGTEGGHYLALLVDKICKEVPELARLRLSSLERQNVADTLLSICAAHPQIVPHFHVPLQSGSDHVLRRMNRQYSANEFRELVRELERRFDRPALTTDIVAGFPGETESDFADTLQMVKDCNFIHVHAFPYSPRPGTAAARWKEQAVPGAIANDRVAQLTAAAATNSLAFRRSFIGQEATVIIERGVSAAGHRHGRCERYFDVEVPGIEAEAGELVRCVVTEVRGGSTIGAVVER